MTDPEITQHLSDAQKRLWDEAVRVRDGAQSLRQRSVPLSAFTVLALLRELAGMRASLVAVEKAMTEVRICDELECWGCKGRLDAAIFKVRAALATPGEGGGEG